jgi:hypothetical protein
MRGGASSAGSSLGGQIDLLGGLAASEPGVIKFRTGLTQSEEQPVRGYLNATGDFLLGGTLPSAPNITLKADGSIYSGTTTGLSQTVRIEGGVGTQSDTQGFRCLNSTQSSGGQFKPFPPGDARGNGALLSSDGGHLYFAAGGPDRAMVSGSTGDFLLGGTLPASPNITLSATGTVAAKVIQSYGYYGTVNKGATVTLFAAGSLPFLQAGRLTVTAFALHAGDTFAIRTYLIYNNSPNWIIKELTADSMAVGWVADDTCFVVGGSGTAALTLQAVIDNMVVRASVVF